MCIKSVQKSTLEERFSGWETFSGIFGTSLVINNGIAFIQDIGIIEIC